MTSDAGPAGLLEETIAAISPLDATAVAAATERQQVLTKPNGSLGRLEELSVQLAGIYAQCPPPLPAPAVVAVFAADQCLITGDMGIASTFDSAGVSANSDDGAQGP